MAINLGKPTGPALRGMTAQQKRMLDAWLTSALCTPPHKREPMPMDYTRALAGLARRRGIHVVLDGRDNSNPVVAAVSSNRTRKVVVSKPWK